MTIVHISAYQFVALDEATLLSLQQQLKDQAKAVELKGTILLSPEGINLMMAGLPDSIAQFQAYLATIPAFAPFTYKKSISTKSPFLRLIVKIKKEIIRMNCDEIQPLHKKANYITPAELKQWYDQGRDMVILDTRNDYEVAIGSFKNAINLQLSTFSEFPQAVAALPEAMKQQPIVTFCTGGIRCEKAAIFLLNNGFQEVYQLAGGILNYFEKCGGQYFQGDCFVFDNRMALDAALTEIG